MTLQVDPEMLRAFAQTVESAAGGLENTDVTTAFSVVEDALPGTDLRASVELGCGAAILALENMCERLRVVADIADGVADDYRITEDDFAMKLRMMDVPS
ncbi:hypothetical protein ABH922_000133 [Rhodococcus sp. 27YEA15]|uniref:hypothetical protein n=1 Tax=Rhodococcus sp. 27YEA15 TaxID=3156259 RepID=UPI003C7B6D32